MKGGFNSPVRKELVMPLVALATRFAVALSLFAAAAAGAGWKWEGLVH
jgi:hypothetical protein